MQSPSLGSSNEKLSRNKSCLTKKARLEHDDNEDQHLARRIVHVQPLPRPPSFVVFISPRPIHSFHVYTGHVSALALLLYPDTSVRRLGEDATSCSSRSVDTTSTCLASIN